MALNATSGSLVIVGANTINAKVFWDGVELTEVIKGQINFDEEGFVRLKVENTTNFDAIYAEMELNNIVIKK
jgi:hypothetical protein